MDFPILSTWMSPFSSLGESGVKFHFVSFFDEIHFSKQNSPRWDAAFCGVPSGAILLPMSHTKDTRLFNYYSRKVRNLQHFHINWHPIFILILGPRYKTHRGNTSIIEKHIICHNQKRTMRKIPTKTSVNNFRYKRGILRSEIQYAL